MEQRSEAWFQARLGKVTASRVADVLAKIKSGEAAVRRDYRAQLVSERLTGVPQESYSNGAMQWGTEQEPFARSAYEVHIGKLVTEVGFIEHPTIQMAGASPDGLVDSVGLVEIKCPNTATHLDTLLSEEVPSKYLAQMQWQMACAGRSWCDFVSFDPRLPEDLQLFVKRVYDDVAYREELEAAVKQFLNEVQEVMNKLNQRKGNK